jgi:sugar lactone lactonase YvrE
VDARDRLWILDTGRALTQDGTLVPASYGGPKLVGVSLANNSVFQTIVFPPTVAYADSYLNDVRFDLRAEVTESGGGVAYITDSSSEGRNGIIVVDLGTGESWRHLNAASEVRWERGFVAYGMFARSADFPNIPLFLRVESRVLSAGQFGAMCSTRSRARTSR